MLKQIVDFDTIMKKIMENPSGVNRNSIRNIPAIEIDQWQKNLAFGAIPRDIVESIQSNNDDWLLKLRTVEDLDHVFESLFDPYSNVELMMLREYARAFVDFIDEYLLQDPSQDMKIIMTALKGIKLLLHPEEKNL